jgi:hypothetical protein
MSEVNETFLQQNPAVGDWHLATLVDMANYNGLRLGIVLSTGGFLVSGRLIGGSEYFDSFSELFVSNFSDLPEEEKNSLQKSMAGSRDIYKSAKGPPSYIHLKDAQFFAGGGSGPLPGNMGVLWRGRLCEVTGFFLGHLSVDKSIPQAATST